MRYRMPLWARVVFGPALPIATLVALPIALILWVFDLAPLGGLLIMACLAGWVAVAFIAHEMIWGDDEELD